MADGETPDAYRVSPLVRLASETRPYERRAGDPLGRPLRIFALDAGASVLDGAVATIRVPYEPVEPTADGRGFRGRVFEIDAHDGGVGRNYAPLDLNDAPIMLDCGREPSPSDPYFHQQMVYAVCMTVYASFRRALGRHPAWGFTARRDPSGRRLLVSPYGAKAPNAWFDKDQGAIVFGYFDAPPTVRGRTAPGGPVFTSLSHDVVVHEVTHALLDGLRSQFTKPTNPDVPAFHEAFADLMAIFHRFSHANVVAAAIARSGGQVDTPGLLTNLAQQFGQAIGTGDALRSPIEPPGSSAPRQYDPTLEPHALGTVLVSAVFEAFATVVRRKSARYIRVATGGSGVLPPGELPSGLRDLLAQEASRVARQFLEICIRAIDYCPPVDVSFGEFLRAVLTADVQLIDDDRWGYREAWIDAFRVRGILPRHVRFVSLDALLWRAPDPPALPIDGLAFRALQFDGDPARPAGPDELERQGHALGAAISRRDVAESLGLAAPGDARLGGDEVTPPTVRSIRTARRVGADGRVLFDLVAEVTQRRRTTTRGGQPMSVPGGVTVIVGPDGRLRYAVCKSVLSNDRIERQRAYVDSNGGRMLWELADGSYRPRAGMFRALHQQGDRALGPSAPCRPRRRSGSTR